MRGRRFLDAARRLKAGGTEEDCRGAVVLAYYAAFLECRDAFARWGVVVPRANVHPFVRLRFDYSTDPDLKAIGRLLDALIRRRNAANYDLTNSPARGWPPDADAAIANAEDALALLDAIEADSARRAAAIASLPP